MSDQIHKEIDAIDAMDAMDVIPPVQMPQILKVLNERRRQDAKWGEQNHNDYYWLGILAEEFGEAAKALIDNCDRAYPAISIPVGGIYDHTNIQHSGTASLERELTHVAAVAVAWLEAIQRRKAS
jgi:hypothetical protein